MGTSCGRLIGNFQLSSESTRDSGGHNQTMRQKLPESAADHSDASVRFAQKKTRRQQEADSASFDGRTTAKANRPFTLRR